MRWQSQMCSRQPCSTCSTCSTPGTVEQVEQVEQHSLFPARAYGMQNGPAPTYTQKSAHRTMATGTLIMGCYLLWNYNFGPAATRALPASLPSYLAKFLMKRAARSFAFSSHLQAQS